LPPRIDTNRRATPPYPSSRPREISVSARPSTPQPTGEIKAPAAYAVSQVHPESAPRPTLHAVIEQVHSHDTVTLPPLSDLERIAGTYKPYNPHTNQTDFATRRRSDQSSGSRTLVSEEDVRQSRITLMEGRRWIWSMLDETNELLKALDEVHYYKERIEEEAGSRDVRVL
jgi:hypothetical protein